MCVRSRARGRQPPNSSNNRPRPELGPGSTSTSSTCQHPITRSCPRWRTSITRIAGLGVSLGMVGTKRRHDRGRLRIRVGLWSRAGHMTLLRIRVLAAAAAVGSLRALVRELRALVRETTLARILTLTGLTAPLARATGPEIGLVRIALSQHRGGLIRRLPIAPRLGRFVARLPGDGGRGRLPGDGGRGRRLLERLLVSREAFRRRLGQRQQLTRQILRVLDDPVALGPDAVGLGIELLEPPLGVGDDLSGLLAGALEAILGLAARLGGDLGRRLMRALENAR